MTGLTRSYRRRLFNMVFLFSPNEWCDCHRPEKISDMKEHRYYGDASRDVFLTYIQQAGHPFTPHTLVYQESAQL